MGFKLKRFMTMLIPETNCPGFRTKIEPVNKRSDGCLGCGQVYILISLRLGWFAD